MAAAVASDNVRRDGDEGLADGDKRQRQRANIAEHGVTGHVKWFDARKMYGFIARDGSDPNDEKEGIFVHYTAIVRPTPLVRITALGRTERVIFDLVHTEKGPEAHNVRAAEGKYSVRGMSCDVDAELAEEMLGVRPRVPARVPPQHVIDAALRVRHMTAVDESVVGRRSGGRAASTQTKGGGKMAGNGAPGKGDRKPRVRRRRRAASTSLLERVSDSLLNDETSPVPRRRRRKPALSVKVFQENVKEKTGDSTVASDEKGRKPRRRPNDRRRRRMIGPAMKSPSGEEGVARPRRRPAAMTKEGPQPMHEDKHEARKARVSAGGDSAAGAVRDLVEKVSNLIVAQ